MKKTRLAKLFDNKRFSLVLSIVIAALAWLVVSMSDESNATRTIYDVPVDFTYNASTYRNLGFDIIDQEEVKVDLEIRGPAKDIGRLSAKDFVVYPNVNSVVSAGTKELDLVYQTARKNVSYQVTDCSQTTVTVQFDEVATQKFTVEPELSQLEIKEGYIYNAAYTTPGEISITGPKTKLGQIAKIQARLQQELGELSDSRIAVADVVLLSREGIELDMSPFTLDTKTVDVTIPVLKRATLKLDVDIINPPQGFDTSILKYTLSPNELQVAVPVSKAVNELETLCIGYVDMQSIDLSEPMVFQIDKVLPEGYVNSENINEVTLTFNADQFATKPVTIQNENIRLINKPAGYEITVETQRLNNVLLVGTQSQLDKIDGDAVIAQIDASKLSMLKGEQNVPVQIIISSSSAVFATGKYTVMISISTAAS